MITYTCKVGARMGRIFVADAHRVRRPDLERRFRAGYFDDAAETDRAARLEAIVAAGRFVAATHRGVDVPDALYVYARDAAAAAPEGEFACLVVSRSRLDAMLAESRVTFEGFSFQVADGPALSEATVRTALEAWCARNFPARRIPHITLDPWSGALEMERSGVQELLLAEETASVRAVPPMTVGLDTVRETVMPDARVARPAA